jgi:hypothetical protein
MCLRVCRSFGYIFEEITSPDFSQIDVSVDIEKRLQKMKSTDYSCEFEFINVLWFLLFYAISGFLGAYPRFTRFSLVILPTRYICKCHCNTSSCNLAVLFYPFQLLGAYYDDSSLRLRVIGVRESTVTAYDKLDIQTGTNLSDLIGSDVIRINGQDAASFVVEFAKTNVGFSEELSQRFEAALDQPGLQFGLFFNTFF